MRGNTLAYIVFMCGLMSGLMAVYAWNHRVTRGSKLFSFFMASLTIYVLGYSMELASLNVATMLFWSKIEYLGIYSFPTLFLLFVLRYTGQDKWLTRRIIHLLFVVPTILLFSKLSDDIFHLVYQTTWLDTSGPIPLLGFTRGPIYPMALYSAIPVSLAIFLLWKKRRNTPLIYRNQATLLAVSAIGPIAILLLYMSGFQPYPGLKYLDLNPFLYPIWAIGVGWAAFRYRLFDLTPIAREVLIEHLSDGVFVLDDQSRLVDANPVALHIIGRTKIPVGENAGKVFFHWKELWSACQMEARGAPVSMEIEHIRNGEKTFYDLSITDLKDKSESHIGRLIMIHDITERKRLEEQLLELSLVDELTGLSNRRGFYILANQFINMANRMDLKAVLIFADLDKLKMINDTYGHTEGDHALVDAAALLRSTSRSSDILARWGGDEFVVLAMRHKDDPVDTMVDRVKKKLDEFNALMSRNYELSISFGVAYYDPGLPVELENLVHQADQAMYIQKQAKKKPVVASLN